MDLNWKEGDTPIVGEFLELRQSCELERLSAAAAAKGLSGSLHCVTAKQGARLVAMGRIVGDTGLVAVFTDVMVAPDVRGQGVGTEVVRRLSHWCEENLPRACTISFVAQPGTFALYRKAGFEIRTGMVHTLS